jgi:hypothetical protein
MIKSTQFSHQKRTFEVRATVDANEVMVRVYENDKRATPAVYSVTIETAFDAQVSGFPLNVVDGLMQMAEEDVKEGRVPIFGPSSN